MLSRALYEYDGSVEPEEQGYAGPFEYRDCPVFNVLQGIWAPESLIGAVESWDAETLGDEALMSEDYVLAAMCCDPRTDFNEIAATVCDDFYIEDWIRHDAADLLRIGGVSNEVTGDGSVVVCNVRTELAINQRQMCADFYLMSACARRPEVAAICGLQASLGGVHSRGRATAAYATVGALSHVEDPRVEVAARLLQQAIVHARSASAHTAEHTPCRWM